MAASNPGEALGMGLETFSTALSNAAFIKAAEKAIDQALASADQTKIRAGKGVLLHCWCHVYVGGGAFRDMHCSIVAYPSTKSEAEAHVKRASYLYPAPPGGYQRRSSHDFLPPGKIQNPLRGLAGPMFMSQCTIA